MTDVQFVVIMFCLVTIIGLQLRNYDEIRNIRLNPPKIEMRVVYENKPEIEGSGERE